MFDAFAFVAVEGAVMKGGDGFEVGTRRHERAVPTFGLRTRIGKEDCGKVGIELGENRREHRKAEMAGPRQRARIGRKD